MAELRDPSLTESNAMKGVHAVLGIDIVSLERDRVELRLSVGPDVHQPFGILHGGVSALLAESAASMGGSINVAEGQTVVGVELNANHLRSVRDGTITAVATPVHVGRSIHVWDIRITDEQDRAICVSRCTLAVRDLPAR